MHLVEDLCLNNHVYRPLYRRMILASRWLCAQRRSGAVQYVCASNECAVSPLPAASASGGKEEGESPLGLEGSFDGDVTSGGDPDAMMTPDVSTPDSNSRWERMC